MPFGAAGNQDLPGYAIRSASYRVCRSGQESLRRVTATSAYGTAAQRQQWQALIATLEQSLRLHRHQPGQLLRLDAYLHERTDGMLGSLSHLIPGAAVEPIPDGPAKL